MKRIILLSNRPNMLVNYLNGLAKQLILKHALHEGDEVHLYCTKGKPYLSWEEGDYDCDDHGCHFADYTTFNTKYEWIDQTNGEEEILNGKVVAKFIVGKVEKLDQEPDYETSYQKIAKESCLSFDEYYGYATWAKNAIVYSHTITQLEIFDRPRELGEYSVKKSIKYEDDGVWTVSDMFVSITNAPQSYMHAWVEV